MKKILTLLSGLTLVTPLPINLYSCNNSEKEDPKVSQQKVDELVDLFNYYNENNVDEHFDTDSATVKQNTMLHVIFDEHKDRYFKKYQDLKLDQVYKLDLQKLLFNSIIFNAYYTDISLHIKDSNGKYGNKEFIKNELSKFDFLHLNLEKTEEYSKIFVDYGVSYWINVWNNPQVRVVTERDDILEEIRNEKKGRFPTYEVINLKLRYTQKNGTMITSKKSFKFGIENKLSYSS